MPTTNFNMRSSNRQLGLGAVGLLVLVGVMARMFIWPGYREAAAVRRQVSTLRTKIAGLGDTNQQVHKLGEQVDQMRRRVSEDYKSIPDTPEVAELIRKLSLSVDGVSVLDQTFTAGSAEDLAVTATSTLRVLPLKVEMSATFESIFALLRSAERMDQLVRISSVKVICKRDDKTSDVSPMLNASVGLEALYDPPAVKEGH